MTALIHSSLSQRLRRFGALLCAGALLAGGFVTAASFPNPLHSAPAAQALSSAVSQHPRYDLNYMGSWQHSSGTRVFCLEMLTLARSSGSDQGFTTVDKLGGFTRPSYKNGSYTYPELSVTATKQISWIATQYVQTDNPLDASAAQAAIWQLAGGPAPDAIYRDQLASYLRIYDGYGGAITTSARMQQILAEAAAAVAADAELLASAAAAGTIELAQLSPYRGVAELPAGITSATITGAEFLQADGSPTSHLDFTAAGLPSNLTVTWQATPSHELGWSRFYEISVTAAGVQQVQVTGDPLVSFDAEHQTTVTVARPRAVVQQREFSGRLAVDTTWEPLVSTQTPSQFVPHGSEFADTVTFTAVGGDANWRVATATDGSLRYAPVTATGTLYGPFLSDPALNPAATAPHGAPQVGTVTLTTTAEQGPGTYPVQVPWQATEAGYYTWVWQISGQTQPNEVLQPPSGEAALSPAYFFTDGYGQPSERQIVPTQLDFSTRVSRTEVPLGGSFTDFVEVALRRGSGGWLQDDTGQRIPAVLHGQVYYSAVEPVQQPAVPSDAVPIGEPLWLTVTGPDSQLESVPIAVPPQLPSGFLTVVWCVRETDQPAAYRGRIASGCDAYGVPSETVRIVRPQVVTQAVSRAAVAGLISDTATLSGALPEAPTRLRFTGYLLPAPGQPKYDEQWQQLRTPSGTAELWTAAELAGLSREQLCELQPVTVSDFIQVTSLGEITSPEVVAGSVGTLHWVEELQVADLTNGEFHTVHRGECGLPHETTVISEPQVITKALQEAQSPEAIFDTALVSGPLAVRDVLHYELSFAAYDVTELDPAVAGSQDTWCTPARLLWQSAKPQLVTAAGEYRSADFTLHTARPRTVFWVETLTRVTAANTEEPLRELVHQGKCGAVGETTEVAPAPQLPATGATAQLHQLLATNIHTQTVLGAALCAAAILLLGLRRWHAKQQAIAGGPNHDTAGCSATAARECQSQAPSQIPKQ